MKASANNKKYLRGSNQNCYRPKNEVIVRLYVQKTGPNWGYWAQNAVKVVKFIKIVCFQWS
jgi:hypothetical protein